MHIWKEHMMCMRLDDMHKNEANLTYYVRLYDSLDILNMLHSPHIHTRTVPLSDYYIGSNTLDNMCNAIMCIDGRALDVRLLSYLPLLPTTKEMIFSALFRFFLMVKSASNRCQSSQKECNFYQEKQSFKLKKLSKVQNMTLWWQTITRMRMT